jgi:predicted AAA+ superfamily ATPase
MTHVRDRLVAARIAGARTSVLLLGPRQVGKSTLCRALAPALYLDLADHGTFIGYAKDTARLGREVEALPEKALVVVDEIQRVPDLLDMVQALIDRSGRRRRFILTGSSARKLRRGGANLLPGRVVLERLDPLTVLETGGPVDLDRALQLGMLPGVYWGGSEAVDLLGTYAEVYLREEIKAEAATRDVGGYARFLDTMAIASGHWVNYSKLSADVEVGKETVRRFVQLLDDTLLAFRLPPFRPTVTTSRRLVQRERVILFDVGVRNALLGLHRRPLTADQCGSAFEQWVMLQVIYLDHALRKGWKLSTYRTESGAEVDLIVERDEDVVAIEIKAGRQVSVRDTRGLQSFAEMVGRRRPVRRWIIFRGERAQRFESGVEALPVIEALERLAHE